MTSTKFTTPLPPFHPEIRSAVSLTAAHARKVYFFGPLVKRVELQPDGQKPAKDEGWLEVWAQLAGTTLSIWDMKELQEAGRQGRELPPTYVNVADAFVDVMGSVTVPATATKPPTRYSNILTLNTAGSNVLLFSCPSGTALNSWASALRLSSWEKSRLEEVYTAHLIRMILNRSDAPTTLTRGKLEGWVRVRVARQTEWKRVWMVVTASPSDLTNTTSIPDNSNGFTPPKMKRLSNFFSRDTDSKPTSDPIDCRITMYASQKPKEHKKILLSLKCVTQAFAVYPERPELISRSTLIKVEGLFGDEEMAQSMKSTEGWILFMPEIEDSSVNRVMKMLKWITGIHDAFKLYGRPTAWNWDPRQPFSLMFGYPVGPQKDLLFLDREAAETMDLRVDRTSAIRNTLLSLLIQRVQQQLIPQPSSTSQTSLADQPPMLPPIFALGGSGAQQQNDVVSSLHSSASTRPQLPPLSFTGTSNTQTHRQDSLWTPITDVVGSIMTHETGTSSDGTTSTNLGSKMRISSRQVLDRGVTTSPRPTPSSPSSHMSSSGVQIGSPGTSAKSSTSLDRVTGAIRVPNDSTQYPRHRERPDAMSMARQKAMLQNEDEDSQSYVAIDSVDALDGIPTTRDPPRPPASALEAEYGASEWSKLPSGLPSPPLSRFPFSYSWDPITSGSTGASTEPTTAPGIDLPEIGMTNLPQAPVTLNPQVPHRVQQIPQLPPGNPYGAGNTAVDFLPQRSRPSSQSSYPTRVSDPMPFIPPRPPTSDHSRNYPGSWTLGRAESPVTHTRSVGDLGSYHPIQQQQLSHPSSNLSDSAQHPQLQYSSTPVVKREAKDQVQQTAYHTATHTSGRANAKKPKGGRGGAWDSTDEEDADTEPIPGRAPQHPGSTKGHATGASVSDSVYEKSSSGSQHLGQPSPPSSYFRASRSLPQPPFRPGVDDRYDTIVKINTYGQPQPRHFGAESQIASSNSKVSHESSQTSQSQFELPESGAIEQPIWSRVLNPGPGRNFNPTYQTYYNNANNIQDTFGQLKVSETMTKAFTPQGLLAAGLQDKHDRSARRQEEHVHQMSASLINVPSSPQTGSLGMFTGHEREWKREGTGSGLGERENEQQIVEEQQGSQLEQMQQGGYPGFNPMMAGGGVLPMVTGNGINPITGYPGVLNLPQIFAAQQVAAAAYQKCNLLLSKLLNPGTSIGKRFVEKNLVKEDSQCLIDYLTKVFDDEIIVERDQARRLLSLLFRLSKSNQVFPAARNLKDVHCDLVRPLYEGGFGCVYKGTYQGQAVAVKAARLTQFQDNSHNLKAQAREFALWAHLSHRNIVPFYGVYLSEETVSRICIVSPWMENGNLNRYLVTSPDVLRIPLLLDVINGLQYLHQLKIIHTDLKGGNILVSGVGRAMITDFGISSIAITLQTVTTGPTGTPYWIAPEVVTGTTRPTLESDIWSYGCVCYEVFTGKTPFYQYTKPHLLIVAFLKGHITPTRPTAREAHEQLTDETWELMMECWNHDPQKRPTPEEIISFFQILDIPDGRPPAEDEQIITANVRAARSKTVIDYDRTYGILDQLYEAGQSNSEDGDDDDLEYA